MLTQLEKNEQELFLVAPYLQLGTNNSGSGKQAFLLTWQITEDDDAIWSVHHRTLETKRVKEWRACSPPSKYTYNVIGLGKRTLYKTTLAKLAPGKPFQYRVIRNGVVVFSSDAKSLKTAQQSARFVLLGDGADGTETARQIALAVENSNPDLLLYAGDNAYEDGTYGQYEELFFPVYNAKPGSHKTGAALLRRIVSALVPGNHDVRTPGFETRAQQDREPEVTDDVTLEATLEVSSEATSEVTSEATSDAKLPNSNLIDSSSECATPDQAETPNILGYFTFFEHPQNGPQLNCKQLKELKTGNNKRKRLSRFLGKKFLARTNYSFDCANVHLLMLDGNKYADWSNSHLRDWVRNDLRSATTEWKVVVIHQPPFTGADYSNEQRNRLLCDIFQEEGVDVVLSGHCHAYERTYPLRFFRADETNEQNELVPGTLALDLDYDGKVNTHPNGIIYVVSGTAGHISTCGHTPVVQPFSYKIINNKPSYTLCDVRGQTLIVRQIDASGNELDSFMIDK